ncbi:hypothetical protein CKF54_07605 [Psittacicella hinzii]|uniref:Uncharacterized protein n=1 Tax=Psittacicella hinzii TaxID=2028575 RepID=A0A3A1XYK9_9GAMM|nr:hypothetical protein [Psittacicella hinzii]RIY31112.1 hypothetical protein CKF54_07605 [Psittacicella hinzii]
MKISGDQGVTLDNGTKIISQDEVEVASADGSVKLIGTNISVVNEEANVTITAKKDVIIDNTNLSGNAINTQATTGSSTITNNTLNADVLIVDAKDSSTFTGNNLNITNSLDMSGQPIDFSDNSGFIQKLPKFNGGTGLTREVESKNPKLFVEDKTGGVDTELDFGYDWLEMGESIPQESRPLPRTGEVVFPTSEVFSVLPDEVRFSTCYLAVGEAFSNSGVTAEDMSNLTIEEIMDKYGISDADSSMISKSCLLVPGFGKTKLPGGNRGNGGNSQGGK